MKKMIRTLVMLALTLIVCKLPVSAMEVNSSNFDYVLYADMYPDCKKAFGYNKAALYKHYINSGIPEGRVAMGSRVGYLTEKVFDYKRYAAEYPEVVAVVGNSRKALYNHYVHNGVREGKLAWSTSRELNIRMRAFDIVSSVTTDSMTDREKVRAVHYWIACNTSYNMSSYLTKNYLPTDFDADGPLLCGTAVCSGYAEAFAACMRELGIKCSIPYSANHAWNEVCINENGQMVTLALDCCWDDPVPDQPGVVVRYDYFLIPIEVMNQVQHHQKTGYY